MRRQEIHNFWNRQVSVDIWAFSFEKFSVTGGSPPYFILLIKKGIIVQVFGSVRPKENAEQMMKEL